MDQLLAVEGRRAKPSVPLIVQQSSAGLAWTGLHSSFDHVLPTTRPITCPRLTGEQMIIVHRSSAKIRWRESGKWTLERVTPGSVHLVPSATELSVMVEDDLQAHRIIIGSEILVEVASEFVRGDPDKIRLRHAFYTPPAEAMLLFDSIGAATVRQDKTSAIYAEYAARAVAAQLLLAWSVEEGRILAPPKLGRSRTVAQATDFMHANLSAGLTLQMIAAAVGVSITALSREFRADLNMTPHRALIELRLLRAQQLLKLSQPSLSDVAAQCGFSSQEHMTRLFRSRLGSTPGAYRRAFAS